MDTNCTDVSVLLAAMLVILAIVERDRDHDQQTRAAAPAEVRARQARMNPHFLSNALNAIAALAVIAPGEVPRAGGVCAQFLRASSLRKRDLNPQSEQKARNALKYLVCWEVRKLTRPRKKGISSEWKLS